MTRTATILVLLMGFLASGAQARPDAGDRELVLSGSGTTDDEFNTSTFSASGQIGWFATDAFEWGVRQSLGGVAQDKGNDTWSASTRAFADYHFGRGNVMPFVGANLGGIYGESVNDTGTAGIEGGLKFFVKDETFIMLMAEYQFLFESADEIDNQFDDGAFFYTLGVGFNF